MKVHKRLLTIFQALLLVTCLISDAKAKKTLEWTPDQVQKIIEQASQKKDFSKEFDQMVQAPSSVEPILISTLSSTANSWEQRWFSAIVLGKRGSQKAQKALLKAAQDELFIVRQAAVQGLSYFSDDATAAAIRNALNDTAMVVRSEAVDAIHKRKDVGALTKLEEQLYKKHNYQKGRSMWIRPQIVHVLGELGAPESLPVLQKTLRDRDEKVSSRSCQSLQTLAIKNKWDYPVRSKDCVQAWNNWFQNRAEQVKVINKNA